jgi:hypothetical protein
MKLYYFLVLSFFAFVSCENISSQNVYEFKHKGEIQESAKVMDIPGLSQTMKISIDAKLKITISDEDDCAYFIYECQRPWNDFTTEESHKGEEISDAESDFYDRVVPEYSILSIEDKEGNIIEKYDVSIRSSFSIFNNDRNHKYPILHKGKLYQFIENSSGNYERKDISSTTMRSKFNRMENAYFKIGFLHPDRHRLDTR